MSYSPHFFFNLDFRHDLDWAKNKRLRLGTIQAQNREQLSQGLKDLSRLSIRNRFMGSKKEFSEKELSYLTQFDGENHYALGLEERESPFRGVAVARLVRSDREPIEAEVAITIIDEYQKLGLGSLLMKLIVLAAFERQVKRLSFTFLPQNVAIRKLIERIGPTNQVEHPNRDDVHLMMDLSRLDLSQIKREVEALIPGVKFPATA